ncbi:hypothetical protein QR680_010540 [Steinernema hermaphroditum]|uniref:Triacylglycerol lipase n=1 Tax=Steinernema hermaphroditum TaxID=289476 RepID=A0AA39IR74_9BILA|nr:hypothetical protein QR680_010540 [Steinernema hermaphroditum]
MTVWRLYKMHLLLKAFLLLAIASAVLPATLKDMGAPGFNCPASIMAKSKTVPTSAHQVRYADIKVVAALGDSLTAGNGAGAQNNDPVQVLLQYRGLVFHIGADKDLDEHITIPNILKKFNPNLFGASTGIGSVNVWESAQLNEGFPGAQSSDLPRQAKDLVDKMKSHHEVDVQNDWKLVNIFIGGNDICGYCHDKKHNKESTHSPYHFGDNIAQAVKILQEGLPRTIVSLTGMFNMRMLRRVDQGQLFCEGLHLFECECEIDQQFTNEEMSNVSLAYMQAEQQLQDSGMFDAKDDFTFVIQPFFEKIVQPPLLPDGKVDLSFFAPDCFHFSQFGHAAVAKELWNTIVQPVGVKQRQVNLTNYDVPLRCPDASNACPFFPTTKNSANCVKYWTAPDL